MKTMLLLNFRKKINTMTLSISSKNVLQSSVLLVDENLV